MKRFQILLDEKLHNRLRREAFKRRATISALVRKAVLEWFDRQGRTKGK